MLPCGGKSSPKAYCPCNCVPRVSSSCLPPRQQAFQDQGLGRTQDPFKLLLVYRVPKHVRFCVCCLRMASLFSTALWLSVRQFCTPHSKSPWTNKEKRKRHCSSIMDFNRDMSLKYTLRNSPLCDSICHTILQLLIT